MHQNEQPGLTPLGKVIFIGFIGACIFMAFSLFTRDKPSDSAIVPAQTNSSNSAPTSSLTPPGEGVEIGIAYGTEKRRWLTWATEQFAKSKAGSKITVNLIPMGSLEGARAVVSGDERINVWSPASSAYKDAFLTEWQLQHTSKPIAHEETLALSPMVFVFWKERFEAFAAKYGQATFSTIGEALQVTDGWAGIAQKPEWGFFKFGHTNPNESNSGLLTLTLMAHHYHNKLEPLQMADIMNPGFQKWHGSIESAVTGLSNSTGNMMREMILKGPSSFDAIVVYENVAIDYLKNAEGRWGTLQVVYPDINIWNDNPYYILDTKWSGKDEQKAAQTFLDFLMSAEVQKQSLVHGFRPGDPAVSIKESDSPFVQYQPYGLKIELNKVCEPPTAQAINELLTGWQRIRSSR